MKHSTFLSLGLALLLLAAPLSAQAYVGPGAGITAIGTVIALAAAVVLAIVGFLWYPLKRLFAKQDRRKDDDEGEEADSAPAA